jgi:hypothetical protein
MRKVSAESLRWEMGDRVFLQEALPDIPAGTLGTVVEVNIPSHPLYGYSIEVQWDLPGAVKQTGFDSTWATRYLLKLRKDRAMLKVSQLNKTGYRFYYDPSNSQPIPDWLREEINSARPGLAEEIEKNRWPFRWDERSDAVAPVGMSQFPLACGMLFVMSGSLGSVSSVTKTVSLVD